MQSNENTGNLQYRIRDETPSDIESIRQLTEIAFKKDQYQPIEHLITDKLREDGDLTLSLVAENKVSGEIIGHIAFSPVSIENGVKNWYGLGPISVSPNCQGTGIGSALVKEGLAKLVEIYDAQGCVLLGSPKYYNRFGFKSGSVKFKETPEQYVMSLNLQNSNETPSGQITYRPAFYI